ncbi:hypothetical protein HHK36_017713 [Tetracentron sinense]|uniref:Protein POLYCHOME n=1 Tax=Tetracentron sinense TaxID=13715 RepID=A0A834Z034_TETSI|nr:hypothetical protein HHK36_017713 [Tetracentron sinense]
MPESRDRLSRADEPTPMISRRRTVGSIGILVDEPERGSNLFGSPFRWGSTAMTASRGLTIGPMAASRSVGMGRAGYGTPRLGNGRGRILYGSPSSGPENSRAGTGRRGRGRGTNSPLPSWYPRTPLRDITGVVRAIERRRSRLSETEGHRLASPTPQELSVLDPTVPISGAPLEHDMSMITPNPTASTKPLPSHGVRVPKMLLDINNQTAGESDFLTPQKKLLNSIDQVEKVVMEEFRRMKRTPSAKKAEREKKVRTLMTMR